MTHHGTPPHAHAWQCSDCGTWNNGWKSACLQCVGIEDRYLDVMQKKDPWQKWGASENATSSKQNWDQNKWEKPQMPYATPSGKSRYGDSSPNWQRRSPLCFAFERKGWCHNGDDCPYRHDRHQTRGGYNMVNLEQVKQDNIQCPKCRVFTKKSHKFCHACGVNVAEALTQLQAEQDMAGVGRGVTTTNPFATPQQLAAERERHGEQQSSPFRTPVREHAASSPKSPFSPDVDEKPPYSPQELHNFCKQLIGLGFQLDPYGVDVLQVSKGIATQESCNEANVYADSKRQQVKVYQMLSTMCGHMAEMSRINAEKADKLSEDAAAKLAMFDGQSNSGEQVDDQLDLPEAAAQAISLLNGVRSKQFSAINHIVEEAATKMKQLSQAAVRQRNEGGPLESDEDDKSDESMRLLAKTRRDELLASANLRTSRRMNKKGPDVVGVLRQRSKYYIDLSEQLEKTRDTNKVLKMIGKKDFKGARDLLHRKGISVADASL